MPPPFPAGVGLSNGIEFHLILNFHVSEKRIARFMVIDGVIADAVIFQNRMEFRRYGIVRFLVLIYFSYTFSDNKRTVLARADQQVIKRGIAITFHDQGWVNIRIIRSV